MKNKLQNKILIKKITQLKKKQWTPMGTPTHWSESMYSNNAKIYWYNKALKDIIKILI